MNNDQKEEKNNKRKVNLFFSSLVASICSLRTLESKAKEFPLLVLPELLREFKVLSRSYRESLFHKMENNVQVICL